jgi:hypothetical protein
MIKSLLKWLLTLVLIIVPVTTSSAEPTKRDLLHEMFIKMGANAPDSSSEIATFERNLTDADIKAVIAFFESPAGKHLAIATQEVTKSAMANLEVAIARSKQKRTMADLQTLAVSVEAYASEHDEVYPSTTDLDHLSKLVTPTYLRSMVRLDGWGKEYIYIGDTKNYRILSAGPDGRLSPDSQKLGIKQGDFGDDLIFENAEFISPKPPPK